MKTRTEYLDKLFLNGKIETFDSQENSYEAIGVSGGKIAALGDQSDLKELAGTETEIIDLEGGFLIPGLIDSHTHLMIYAYLLDGIDLAPPGIANIGDILTAVKTAVKSSKPGEWIRGSRFVDYSLEEHRYPTRADLDPVSPDNPVILFIPPSTPASSTARRCANWGSSAVPNRRGAESSKKTQRQVNLPVSCTTRL